MTQLALQPPAGPPVNAPIPGAPPKAVPPPPQPAPEPGVVPAGVDPKTVPGTPEHLAHMVAITEGRAQVSDAPPSLLNGNGTPPPPLAPPAPVAPRPADVPEKFWNAEKGVVNTEALLKSYTELEKSRGAKPPAPGAPAGADPAAPGTGVSITPPKTLADLPDDATPAQITEAAGLKVEDVTKQFATDGKLTDEQYAAYKRMGIPRASVDLQLKQEVSASQQAVAAIRTEAAKLAGGDEQLNNLLAWGKTGLTRDEIVWFDQQADGPAATPQTAARAMEWLVAKYKGAVGAGGAQPLIQGPSSPPAGVTPFANQNEIQVAMSDPRYSPTLMGNPNPKYDAGFHENVNRRLMLSNII